MLSWRRRLQFGAIFFIMMILCLGLSLFLSTRNTGASLFELPPYFAAATIFLAMSGYIVFFALGLCFITYSVARWTRVTVHVVLFLLSYVAFMSALGDFVSTTEMMLMFLGVLSVIVSDLTADALTVRDLKRDGSD